MKKYLTFDDVLLLPHYSEILPRDVLLDTKLTKNISLSTPLVSAAMDTVTESEMAISMALNGGIGIIHKNMSVNQQVEEVEKVKNYDILINKYPFYINEKSDVYKAVDMMDAYQISSIIVVDEDKCLKGILTRKDVKYVEDYSDCVTKHMSKEVISVGENINAEMALDIVYKTKLSKIPVVNENNVLVGLVTMKTLKKYDLYPNRSVDVNGRLICGAAVSVNDSTIERVEALVNAGVDVIVIDSAHGHSKSILDMATTIKKKFDVDLIVGNVVTAEAVEALASCGVDCVKVGVGSGSICTTRIISGVGAPQLSAVMECVKAAKKVGVTIIADGGVRYSGDVVKALAAGADAIMLGSIMAGHDESPGEVISIDGKKYKSYVGMGSEVAMERGGGDRYFQSKVKKYVPEGIEAVKEYKGAVDDTLYQIIGGIKSGLGYLGAISLEKLVEHAEFVEITNSGMKESHPHTINVTKSAPNYENK
ncbi:MAG: IMP dehydrogenase [Bacilli bacterium]